MKELEIALKKFCRAFGRDGFDIGDVTYQPVSNPEYPSELPSTKELDFFYSNVYFKEPVYISGDMILRLEISRELVGRQHGWRWILADNKELYLNPRWNEAWVVIGDRNGDALIVDTSQEGSPVYGAIQNHYFKIANSLARFFAVYSDWMSCEYLDFHMSTTDADYNPLPEYMAKLQELAGAKLTEDEVEGFNEYFFG